MIKKTIQAAVDAAPDLTNDPNRWTIIEVRPGTYTENVTIDNRHIFLMSKAIAGELPVLRCADSGFALSIREGGCAVDGLIIRGGYTQRGVLISTDADADRVLLVNCVIRGAATEYSPGDTAAMIAERGTIRVAQCTFVDNQAHLYATNVKAIRANSPSSVLLENSIIWDATEFTTELSGPITVRNCIVRGRAGDADPLFESRGYPSADNGILLSASSPAINAVPVLNVGKRDIHGGPRGSQPDIGADERNSEDSDGDGVADEFEYRSFGGLTHGPNDDGDADGLDLLGEFNAGTNPNRADTDGDSMLMAMKSPMD